MVFRSRDRREPRCFRYYLSARLAHLASALARTISGLAFICVHGRACISLDRCCFAPRRAFRFFTFGPYGATLVALIGRPAADSARRAAPTAAARVAKESRS